MSSREEDSRRAREDADWQALVDSYGERPEFPEAEPAPVEEPYPFEDDLPAELRDDDEEGFVPPTPPPLQRPHGLRALAWFVGGFGYLVATMSGPKDPDAGWDDGAVL